MVLLRYLTHLSLFTGIGGIDLAAEAAGFNTVGQVEWADFPAAVLEEHWPNVLRWKDIKTLTKEDFYESTGRKSIDLISGGFPCQPFSSAGKRRGFDDDRYLWPEMLRVIKELRPTWVLGENVAGFINMGLDQTLLDLDREGYATRAFVLPAVGVGAWHERTRTFIVGVDVSNSACQRFKENNELQKHLLNPNGDSSQSEPGRNYMDPAVIDRCLLSDSHGIGRVSLNAETRKHDEKQGNLKPCFSDDPSGETGSCQCGVESGLGGMAYGVPPEMDGHRIWREEPEDISRLTTITKNRANRLKTLGNAVVPQQAYPILQAIADIEMGRCKKNCVFYSKNLNNMEENL